MSLRPTTTAWRPAIGIFSRTSSSITPDGRAGHELRPVLHEQPDARRAEAVHVLRRVDRVEDRLLGSASHRPWAAATARGCRRDRGLAFSRCDERERVRERRGLGQPLEVDAKAGARAGLDLVADVHLGGRIVCRPGRCPSPGGRPCFFVNAATSGLISSCIRAASACPSRTRAVMQFPVGSESPNDCVSARSRRTETDRSPARPPAAPSWSSPGRKSSRRR